MPRDVFRLAYRAQMSADDGDTGEVMLYGEIVQDYGKWWKDQYPNDRCASDFDKDLKALKDKGAKRLRLRINSPGGVVTEAVAMRAALCGAGFDSIDIRIEGLCASAATIIASLPGARVEIAPGSEYMIHNPWTIAFGNANDLEHEVEHLRQIEDTARAFYAQRSGQSDEQIKEWMDAETWLNAEDAVKYGFCDAIADEGQDHALPTVACVTQTVMTAMKGLYQTVPDEIEVVEESITDNNVSDEDPDAGCSTEIQNEEAQETMDIRDITQEQLLAENPALVESIRQAAITEERQRQDDIDALTDPGYEELAAQAKTTGMSAAEFVRQLVAAKKQKGQAHQAARQAETAPAQAITGGASEDGHDEASEIREYAESMKRYAGQYGGNADSGMY